MPQTFDYPYHSVEDRYPENSKTVQFGNSWEFASKPSGPPQIQFRLQFEGMFWIFDSNNEVDRTTDPQINMAHLVDFYEAHQLYEKFTYPHPVRGDVTVRFAQPLIVPRTRLDSGGFTDPFEVVLRMQP